MDKLQLLKNQILDHINQGKDVIKENWGIPESDIEAIETTWAEYDATLEAAGEEYSSINQLVKYLLEQGLNPIGVIHLVDRYAYYLQRLQDLLEIEEPTDLLKSFKGED